MTLEYLATLPNEITKEIFNHFTDEDMADLHRQAVEHNLIINPHKGIPTFQEIQQMWKEEEPKANGKCVTHGCNNSAEYYAQNGAGGLCENCIHIREHYVWMLTSAYRDSLNM